MKKVDESESLRIDSDVRPGDVISPMAFQRVNGWSNEKNKNGKEKIDECLACCMRMT